MDLLSGLQPDQLARIASIATEVRHAPGRSCSIREAVDALFAVLDGGVAGPGRRGITASRTRFCAWLCSIV